MSNFNEQQGEFSLKNQIAEVNRKLDALEEKRRALDDELNTHSNQRVQYQLLGTICTSLDKLEAMGASGLFWGGELAGISPDKQLQRVREAVVDFEKKISAIESVRDGVQADIDEEEVALQLLNAELAELEEEAEKKAHELVVDREGVELAYRSYLMPWSKHAEDERRHRKIMAIALFLVILLMITMELLKRPPEKKQEIVLDEKIAALVVKKKPEPKPVEKKPEQPSEAKNASTDAKQAPTDAQQARAAVQSKGVLALKSGFSDLLGGSSDDAKLGSDAHVSNSGKVAAGDAPQRSVIGSQAVGGGSGGISTAGLSRSGVGGGGGGQSITGGGVKLARVESATGAGVAEDRPLSKGSGPSRTDEEVQIVFDRYKAALYRIYNRELRNDPTLRGKMVLRITIEPDGRVSACSVKSTDMASPALSKDIVDRVLNFNFGPKAGVPALTILYPIDFLPAT